MSLKAKIEAVIYASEEPVTLAQLMGLLGQEAQAELDALAAEPMTEPGNDPGVALPTQPEEPVAPAEEAPGGDPAPAPPAATPEPGDPAAPEPAADGAIAKTLAAEARARERRVRDFFRHLLDELIADYASDDRGLEIREVAGGFRLATKPEYHDAVRGFVKSLKPPLKLSLQALETLAVIAYKQPITAPEVSEIRGVDSGGVLGSLMARKLVATAGRKQVIGRPILYKTTKEFLVRFGLKDLNELPSIEEFERMAGEFADAIQEEIPMADAEAGRRSVEDPTAGVHAGDPSGAHDAQADSMPGDGDDRPYSEENLTGEVSAAIEYPADNIAIDGRNVGLDPDYSRDDDAGAIDSPAIDAEVQSHERDGGA